MGVRSLLQSCWAALSQGQQCCIWCVSAVSLLHHPLPGLLRPFCLDVIMFVQVPAAVWVRCASSCGRCSSPSPRSPGTWPCPTTWTALTTSSALSQLHALRILCRSWCSSTGALCASLVRGLLLGMSSLARVFCGLPAMHAVAAGA